MIYEKSAKLLIVIKSVVSRTPRGSHHYKSQQCRHYFHCKQYNDHSTKDPTPWPFLLIRKKMASRPVLQIQCRCSVVGSFGTGHSAAEGHVVTGRIVVDCHKSQCW